MPGSRTERVYVAIRQAIESGAFPVGGSLPTQPELARRLGVSTVTLRQALERLRREGLVVARRGVGTFVSAREPGRDPVLVVDDDREMRTLLAEALSVLGYPAVFAAGGDEALRLVARQHFSHVLLDVRMPGMSGPEVAERVAALDPDAVIVFLTAYPSDLVAQPAGGRWPLVMLRKPFALDELAKVLRVRIG